MVQFQPIMYRTVRVDSIADVPPNLTSFKNKKEGKYSSIDEIFDAACDIYTQLGKGSMQQ